MTGTVWGRKGRGVQGERSPEGYLGFCPRLTNDQICFTTSSAEHPLPSLRIVHPSSDTLLQNIFYQASGAAKRGLEYGVRALVFYGKSTGANGRKRFPTNTYRNIVLFSQNSPKISGNLREFTGECNLGILYSSSLSAALFLKGRVALIVIVARVAAVRLGGPGNRPGQARPG